MKSTLYLPKHLIAAVFFLATTLVAGHGQDSQPAGAQALEFIQQCFRSVAQKILPSVVTVNIVKISSHDDIQPLSHPKEFMDDHGDRDFREPGRGSGVIIEKRGTKAYVLTNYHVIADADEIRITLNDGSSHPSYIAGCVEDKDIALLVFETDRSVRVAELGNSSEVQVGDWAIAVGSPLGYASTFTVGVVSAVGRCSRRKGEIGSCTDYIQTDAVINMGSSGGALVNLYGQLIGINTWMDSLFGGNEGIGFAIPIDNIKKAMEDSMTLETNE